MSEQFKPLQVVSRRQDRTRVARALLAWKRGDKESLDLVMAEANTEPGGTAGMLLQMIASMERSLTPKGEAALEQLIQWDLDADDEERRQS